MLRGGVLASGARKAAKRCEQLGQRHLQRTSNPSNICKADMLFKGQDIADRTLTND